MIGPIIVIAFVNRRNLHGNRDTGKKEKGCFNEHPFKIHNRHFQLVQEDNASVMFSRMGVFMAGLIRFFNWQADTLRRSYPYQERCLHG